MKSRTTVLLLAPLVALGLGACEVQQQEEAEVPDVEVEEGQLPEYEAETGEVEVEQDTVTVPEVEVEEPNGNNGSQSGNR